MKVKDIIERLTKVNQDMDVRIMNSKGTIGIMDLDIFMNDDYVTIYPNNDDFRYFDF